MRVTRGTDSKRQTFEALDSKLAVGLKEVADALNQIEAMAAITLLVPTRTLGFCAALIYFHPSTQRNPVHYNIYSF
jgi:hypothetical protein